MGMTSQATCRDCLREFSVDQGGGFLFELLRCEKCGKTKSISRDVLGKLGMDIDLPPEGKDSEWNKKLQEATGLCNCGGQFTFDAPIRCPKCHSTNIKVEKTTVLYD